MSSLTELFRSQEDLMDHLRQETPKICPKCGSKVKKYKLEGNEMILCKNSKCDWPLCLIAPTKKGSGDSQSTLDVSEERFVDSILTDNISSSNMTETSEEFDSTDAETTFDEDQQEPNNSLQSEEKNIAVDLSLNLVNFGEIVTEDIMETEDVILDVVNDDSEDVVFSNDILVFKHKEGVFIMRFLVPSQDPGGFPTWTQFPGIELPEDKVDFAVALSQELAMEFTRKYFNKDMNVTYTSKAAQARFELGKETVAKLKTQFSWTFIKQLRPKPKKVPKPKKEKKPKPVKVKKVKLPKPKKVKIPKPKKVRRPKATRKIKAFINRLLKTCITKAVREAEVKKKAMRKKGRKLQERPPPIMEISVDPRDLLPFCQFDQDQEVPRRRKDPNEGFDLNTEDVVIKEYRPKVIVPLTYADFRKKPRTKARESQWVSSKDGFVNPDFIICPDIGLDDDLEEDEIIDESDEEYDVKRDFIAGLGLRSKASRRVSESEVSHKDSEGSFIDPWLSTKMFPSSRLEMMDQPPVTNLKKINFNEEEDLDNDDILDSVRSSLAAKSYASESKAKAIVKPSHHPIIEDSSHVNISSGDSSATTITPSTSRSQLLEDNSWLKITKVATGQREAMLLQDRAGKVLKEDEVEVSHGHEKVNVVFHVGKQMITEIPASSNSSVPCPKAKKTKRRNVKEFLDASAEEEDLEKVWKFGWIIDKERLDLFSKDLDRIVKERSSEGRPIPPALALVKEKQAAAEEKDHVKENQVDEMIQFYFKIFIKYKWMMDKYPSLATEESLCYLWTFHKLEFEEFVTKVTALKDMKSMEDVEDDTDDDDLDGSVKFDIQDTSSTPAVVGHGSKTVQFFFQGISFPPVRVNDDDEARLVKTLVNHCSKEFASKCSKMPRKIKPTVGVSLAKDTLPIAVVKHIKSCFTKKWMNLYRPGRRTHQGVKKSEKVPSFRQSTFIQEEPFVPPSSFPAPVIIKEPPAETLVTENFLEEELETNPREYLLRSLLPKTTAQAEKSIARKPTLHVSSGVVEDQPEAEVDRLSDKASFIKQEPEKIVDIDALRKKKPIVNHDHEEEEDFLPSEEDFQACLEAEVFSEVLPKALQGKGPRKGASNREKGRGGRNEIMRNQIQEEKLLTGVDFMLHPTDPQFINKIPDFRAMFKPSVKRKALRIEDLEDDEDDEEFKAVGVPKPKGNVERRTSKRLKVAEEMKESGEYFRPVHSLKVDISVEDD